MDVGQDDSPRPSAGATATYCVLTFGCRVNQADSAGVAAELERGGLERTRSPAQASVVVLNTCTVTHRSDADVRKAVARLKREAPEARVVVTGCFAQRDPAAAAAISGVGAVVGNAHKSRLPVLTEALIRSPVGDPLVVHSAMDSHALDALPVEPVTTVLDRTRPFVKIQDGCDAHCTYCIIPEVRGRARSADPVRVEAAVRTLIAAGHAEIVLAGIHLGTYGHSREDGGNETLEGLTRRLLELPGLRRLRLSCIEPMAFPEGLSRLAKEEPRLAPHFHLPLQSGSDRILKRMVRPYRAAEFSRLLDRIRADVPDACLGTDVIVGFPGETDADFAETCRFVEASGLHYVHVFSYSPRSGTPATRLDGELGSAVIKARARELGAVGRRLWRSFLDRQSGRTRPAVVLEPDPGHPGRSRALTDNFVPADVNAALAPGRDVRLRVLERRGDRVLAELAS